MNATTIAILTQALEIELGNGNDQRPFEEIAEGIVEALEAAGYRIVVMPVH